MRHKFLDGWIEVQAMDLGKKVAVIEVVMPLSLMMACLPVMAKNGGVGSQSISSPLRTWTPALGPERFVSTAASAVETVNQASADLMQRILDIVARFMPALLDASDVVPFLPTGVYIRFVYRCGPRGMLEVLSDLEPMDVIGVPEFRYAMAMVLAELLKLFGDVETP